MRSVEKLLLISVYTALIITEIVGVALREPEWVVNLKSTNISAIGPIKGFKAYKTKELSWNADLINETCSLDSILRKTVK